MSVKWFILGRDSCGQTSKPGGLESVPEQRVPDWLSADVVIIVIAMVIIAVGIWMAS